MSDTSASLLDQLRLRPDGESWRRLVELYTPLIHGWLRRQAVPPEDADDLTQEVLAVVVRELPQFQHNQQQGAFRSWLRTITVNRLRAFWRTRQARPAAAGGEVLDQLEDPNSLPSRLWDREHDQHVMRRLLAYAEPEFTPTTWQAFRRVTLNGEKAAAVAADLGMTVNAVLLAKSHVLRRLRQEAKGLID